MVLLEVMLKVMVVRWQQVMRRTMMSLGGRHGRDQVLGGHGDLHADLVERYRDRMVDRVHGARGRLRRVQVLVVESMVLEDTAMDGGRGRVWEGGREVKMVVVVIVVAEVVVEIATRHDG